MSDSMPPGSAGTPRHVWIVGVLAVLWNCMGAFDYLMTESRNASYLSSFTAEQLTYFYGLPAWTIATWALGVWGGVLGSVLILLRRRLAVPVFAASLIGAVITFAYNYVFTDGLQVMGGAGALVFSGVILGVGVALLVYARRLSVGGVLR